MFSTCWKCFGQLIVIVQLGGHSFEQTVKGSLTDEFQFAVPLESSSIYCLYMTIYSGSVGYFFFLSYYEVDCMSMIL